MEAATERDVAVDRGGDQLVQDAGILAAGTEEPRLRDPLALAFQRERLLQFAVPGGTGALTPFGDGPGRTHDAGRTTAGRTTAGGFGTSSNPTPCTVGLSKRYPSWVSYGVG